MMFKPGQHVLIRPDLKIGRYNNISNNATDNVVINMLHLAGQIVTIKKYSCNGLKYIISEDTGGYWWTEEMFDLTYTNTTLSDYIKQRIK